MGLLWYNYYGKGKAFPRYDLFDVLEDNISPAPLKDSSEIKILVPIANPNHEKDLLYLADNLGDNIVGLNVIKVPQQIGLAETRYAFHENKIAVDAALREKFEDFPAILGHERKYIIAFDHNVTNSIVEQAELENVDFIIMGWHEVDRFRPSVRNITNQVLSSASKNLVVLNGHLPDKIKRIVVAYNGKDNSIYGLYLAKRLLKSTGAELHIIRVVDPECDDILYKSAQDDLTKAAEDKSVYTIASHLIRHLSVENAILNFLEKDDILVIGDSGRRFSFTLLGDLPYVLAKGHKGPVMIIKKHKPLSSGGFRYFSMKYMRKIKSYLVKTDKK
ncbi:MAG: universal stress protein [Methanolobus sp.]